MIKLTNSHMSSKFQPVKDRIISGFRNKPVVQDIDMIRMEENHIKQLIEVKKSTQAEWQPYIKNNFPNRDYSQLDDFNYKALFTLGEILGVQVWIFHYIQNALSSDGINCYKITDRSLNMTAPRNYTLEYIRNNMRGNPSDKCKSRYNNKVKDFDNPNIDGLQENLFYFFQTCKEVKDYYYVEYGGVWTMLVSNPTNYLPLWIYIEVDLGISGLNLDNIIIEDEFFPQIEIHEKTGVPLSIIAYNSNLQDFYVYQYINKTFCKKHMNRKEISIYYGSYIQLLN